MPTINAGTRLFISLAARASNNGVYFYNALFPLLGVDAVYLSTPTPALRNIRAALDLFSVKGAAVAAPFKNDIIAYLDDLSDVARQTGSVNSIRRSESGSWTGHNTDEAGMRQLLSRQWRPQPDRPTVVIHGSGGVVPSVIVALRHVAPDCHILLQARNANAADKLATQWGVQRLPDGVAYACDLFINAAPISLSNEAALSQLTQKAAAVFDLHPVQEEHSFEINARARGQVILRGFDFYLAQFAEQFYFLTGLQVPVELLKKLTAERAA